MLTYLLFAFFFGLGVFILITSGAWAGEVRTKGIMNRLEEITYEEEENPPDEGFFNNARKRGLGSALAQAELPVSEAGFVRTGIILGLGMAALGYLLTGGLLSTAFLVAVSILAYMRWLYGRRESFRLEYESAISSVTDRLASGATIYGTLPGAFMHAAELAPAVIKPDIEYIASNISTGTGIEKTFQAVMDRRKSVALDLLLNTLLTYSRKGSKTQLKEVVEPISETIRSMSSTRDTVLADMTSQRYQMYAMAVIPFIFVMYERSMPGNTGFYNTIWGELSQIVAYSLSVISIFIGEQRIQSVNKMLEL